MPSTDRETYEKILEAFREHPGNMLRAAKMAGVERKTAKRGWDKGWPKRGWPPIKDTIKSEQIQARAEADEAAKAKQGAVAEAAKRQAEDDQERIRELAEQAEHQRQQARRDAVDTRKSEGQMVRSVRGNVIALMNVSARSLRGLMKEAERWEEALNTGTDPLTSKPLTWGQRQEVARRMAYVVEVGAKSAKTAMECERLLMGEPTEIIGVNLQDMSLQDAVHTLEASDRALARAHRKYGSFEVIDGGGAGSDTGGEQETG